MAEEQQHLLSLESGRPLDMQDPRSGQYRMSRVVSEIAQDGMRMQGHVVDQ